VWYVEEVYDWLHDQVGSSIYINMVTSPDYLAIHIAPESVKSVIRQKVKHPEILGYLDIKPHDAIAWKQFIIWTKRQDIYREQSFEDVTPEFFDLIKTDWYSITDLSEESFNGK
jgi:hypothetical protein